jgi:hypothetical protein
LRKLLEEEIFLLLALVEVLRKWRASKNSKIKNQREVVKNFKEPQKSKC